MQKYLIRRLLQAIPTLFLASVIVFLIIALAPGDPAAALAGSEATAAQIAAIREDLGLNRPLPVRYGIWLNNLVHLNLGASLFTKQPVLTMLKQAFPNTLELALISFGLSVLIGFPLGLLAALKQNSWLDSAITAFSSLGLAIPSFWLGILMIVLFSVRLKWLPPSGLGEPGTGWVGSLRYLVMPTITLLFSNMAVFSRFLRTAMIDVMSADYVRTARSKGLREHTVVTRHALKNAMLPVVTIMGIQFGRLLGGAVITESVFAYPGIGRLMVSSILGRDYPVVQATLVLVVLIFLLTNLLVDLAYGYLDPRVKFERAR